MTPTVEEENGFDGSPKFFLCYAIMRAVYGQSKFLNVVGRKETYTRRRVVSGAVRQIRKTVCAKKDSCMQTCEQNGESLFGLILFISLERPPEYRRLKLGYYDL